MIRLHNLTIACAVLALLLCTGLVQAATTSPLTLTLSSTSLTYTKGSSTPSSVTLTVKSTASTFFTVTSSTIPVWLSVYESDGTTAASSGTATATGTVLTLTVNTAVCEALGAGTYSGTLSLAVSGYADATTTVSLAIKNAAATLSVKGGTTVLATGDTYSTTYEAGTAAPSLTLTLLSSNEPISFTAVATSGTWYGLKNGSSTATTVTGVAYNFGSSLTLVGVTSSFLTASPGDTLTGVVTITPTGGTAIVINVSVTVTPPVAHITSITPSSLGLVATGSASYTVIVTGTNFVSSGTLKSVALASTDGTTYSVDAGISTTVVNASTMVLTIATSTASVLTFGTAGTYYLGVCNPEDAGGCTTATGTAALKITAAPIVQSVTSSSSYAQPASGSKPVVAPYDVISIFGKNFLGGDTETVVGSPDASYKIYPTSVYTTAAPTQALSVSFQNSTDSTVVGAGHILFATDTQINVLVPAAIVGTTAASLLGTGTSGGKVQLVVSYNAVAGDVYKLDVAAVNPGIYTLASNGQGDGAILHSDYSVNTTDNPAIAGTTVALIYMTGLGAPTSTGSNVAGTSYAFPKSCLAVTGTASATASKVVLGYLDALNSSTAGVLGTQVAASTSPYTAVDGALIQSSLLTAYHYPPCMSGVTVTINGKTATVAYAGWVADSVAGLYQVNVTVPSTATTSTTAVSVPVLVTFGGVTSQTGVTMYVKKSS